MFLLLKVWEHWRGRSKNIVKQCLYYAFGNSERLQPSCIRIQAGFIAPISFRCYVWLRSVHPRGGATPPPSLNSVKVGDLKVWFGKYSLNYRLKGLYSNKADIYPTLIYILIIKVRKSSVRNFIFFYNWYSTSLSRYGRMCSTHSNSRIFKEISELHVESLNLWVFINKIAFKRL